MSVERVTRRKKRRRRRSIKGRVAFIALALALVIVGAYYIFRFPSDLDEITYPLEYTDLIAQYANEYELDPAHVAAVIFCESSFRPEAVSQVGAMGLMQIMPDTGGWIAEKLNDAEFTTEDLFKPEVNIRYGCWYLDYLSDRFDGDLTKITAAYHAGGTRVDQWLEDSAYSSDGKALTDMPEGATRRYVRHVQSAYEKYKELYAQ